MIIMITSGSFIIYNIEEAQYQKMKEQLEHSAVNIEHLLGPDAIIDLEKDVSSVARKLKSVISLNKYSIYLLDGDGRVVLGTASKKHIGERLSKGVVTRALATKTPQTEPWAHFTTATSDGSQLIDHARPIKDPYTGEVESIIYIEADAREIFDNTSSVMQTIGVAAMLAMGLASLFSAVFARMITVPIKQLTRSAKELAAGSFKRIPIYSTDEIGQLTQSFNYMASELSRTLSDMSSEKSKLEKILENMGDGVMAFNRQGVLIHANSVCYEMLGNTNMDHRFDFIFPKLGVDVSFDQLLEGEESLYTGQCIPIEDKIFSISFAPYTNAKGEGEGLITVLQDVTTQQKLDQMRKEFVANVSHELRTPLTTVKSYTETLIDGAIEDKEVALDFLKVMEKETDRMTSLVQDLLELSRIDNKQMQLNMHKIDMKELILDTVEAQKIHANKKGHELVITYKEEESYEMIGDSQRLRQVLHNILSNAIKYSVNPGKIHIKLYKNKGIVVQVQDCGIGISPMDLGRIFERFYRVDKARSRNLGGTGLGLAIAKEMVELHGGHIKMTSKPGKGTTVTLTFEAV